MVHETTQRDPERIYLEPWPYSPEGRLWSEENVWPLYTWPPEPEGESERAPGVEYIRADLHAAEIARLTRELEAARRERLAARAEAMTAQASLRLVERELEAARERERHIERQIVALVEAEVISEGKAREILGIGVEEWREIEDSCALATDTEASDEA